MSDLATKSVTELRGIVQALGISLKWSWTKADLIKKIEQHMSRAPAPIPTQSDTPSDQRLRTIPPTRNLSQAQAMVELGPYIRRGLVVTFPTPASVQFTYQASKGGLKIESCSLRAPLRDVLGVAKRMMDG